LHSFSFDRILYAKISQWGFSNTELFYLNSYKKYRKHFTKIREKIAEIFLRKSQKNLCFHWGHCASTENVGIHRAEAALPQGKSSG
jgi:hypothetical protein